MALPNAIPTPRVWTDAELQTQSELALNAFVDRRLNESFTKYQDHIRARRKSLQRLFKILNDVDPAHPDAAVVKKILLDKELQASLRYIAGPPISGDDLAALTTRSSRIKRSAITKDPNLAVETLKLICRIADPSRFPWIKRGRAPRAFEIKQAIHAIVALHATQTMQTERRAYGREVEGQLRARLIAEGYFHRSAPNAGKIRAPKDYPAAMEFYGECTLYGRKTDLLVGLADGRIVAIESKDSSSVLNSVKRVLNDTAQKAKIWQDAAGKQVVPIALLSGAFAVKHLRSAQADGLYLVWAHDLGGFVAWLLAQ
jgi:hypothetical protein